MTAATPREGTFRALKVRNFRLFIGGQLVSTCGTWMQAVAQTWLVLKLSHNNGALVGLAATAQFAPTTFFTIWGGVIADRFEKRKVLVLTQSVMAGSAGVLAIVDLSGNIQLWMIFVIALCTGFATAIDTPARHSFVVEMVGPEDVGNAVALHSVVFNVSRVFGPALGGVLIVAVGTGVCFLANAVSFLAVIAALLAMRASELHEVPAVPRSPGQVREGFRYAWEHVMLRRVFAVLCIVGVFGLNTLVVLPLLAKISFNGDAGTFSLMTVCGGVGAIIGALLSARRPRPTQSHVFGGALAMGVCIALSGVAPSVAVLLVLLVLLGVAQMTLLPAANALVQISVDGNMRGRLMAIYTVAVIGTAPIGMTLMGWVAQAAGPREAMVIGGLAIVAAAGVAALAAAHSDVTRDATSPTLRRRDREVPSALPIPAGAQPRLPSL